MEVNKEECIKLYKQGWTTKRLAEKYGFATKKSICDRLRKWNIKLRPSYKISFSKEDKEKMSKRLKKVWAERHDELSEKCLKQFKNQKGEKHPAWKGGVTREWARKVAGEHYKMVCQECGTTEKELIVHHVDGNKRNNELGNLKVLCLSCHAIEHERGSKKWIEEHKK